jgi:hypothetical protein
MMDEQVRARLHCGIAITKGQSNMSARASPAADGHRRVFALAPMSPSSERPLAMSPNERIFTES